MLFLEPDIDCFRINLQRISLPNKVMALEAPTTAPFADAAQWSTTRRHERNGNAGAGPPLPMIAYVGSLNPDDRAAHTVSTSSSTHAGDKEKSSNVSGSRVNASSMRTPGERPRHAYEHVTMAERADVVYRALLSTLQYRFPYELPDTLEHVYVLVITHMASPTFAGQPLGAEDVIALTTQTALQDSPHHFLPAELRHRTFPSHMNCLLTPLLGDDADQFVVVSEADAGAPSDDAKKTEGSEGDKPPRPTTRVTPSDDPNAPTPAANDKGTAAAAASKEKEQGVVLKKPPRFFDSYYLLARDLSAEQQEIYRQCCYRVHDRQAGFSPVSASSGDATRARVTPRSSQVVGEDMTGFSVMDGTFIHYVLADAVEDGDAANGPAENQSSRRSRLDGESRTLFYDQNKTESAPSSSAGHSTHTATREGDDKSKPTPAQQRRIAARSLHFSVYRIPLTRFSPEQQVYYTRQREKTRSRQYFRDRHRRAHGGTCRRTASSTGEKDQDIKEVTRARKRERKEEASRARRMMSAVMGKGWSVKDGLGHGDSSSSSSSGDSEDDDDAYLQRGDDLKGLGLWMTEAEKEAARAREEETDLVLQNLFAAELPERFHMEEAESAARFFGTCNQILSNYIASRIPFPDGAPTSAGEQPSRGSREEAAQKQRAEEAAEKKRREEDEKLKAAQESARATNHDDVPGGKDAEQRHAPRAPKPAPKRKGGPSPSLLARLNARTNAAAEKRKQQMQQPTNTAKAAEREAEGRVSAQRAKELRETVEEASRHLDGETKMSTSRDASPRFSGLARPHTFPSVSCHGVTRLLYSLVPCDCYHMVVSDANPLFYAQSSRAAYRPHTVSLGLISDLTLVAPDAAATPTTADGPTPPQRSSGAAPSARPSYAKPVSSTRASLLAQSTAAAENELRPTTFAACATANADGQATMPAIPRASSPGADTANVVLHFPRESRPSGSTGKPSCPRMGQSDGLVLSPQPSRAVSPDRPSLSAGANIRGEATSQPGKANEKGGAATTPSQQHSGRRDPRNSDPLSGTAAFRTLTSTTDGFLLVTASLCCNNISGNPKHKKETLGEKGISLPSYMTQGGSATNTNPVNASAPTSASPFTRTADNGYANAVVNLFYILSKSSLAQHKLRYGAIRPVVSVAVLEDNAGMTATAAAAAAGAPSPSSSAATSAAGLYGEGSLSSQQSASYCCRGLMDHTWFSLPVQYTPRQQEAIQWMPVVLGATDCVSDVGYRSAVHLGIFPSEEAVRRRRYGDGDEESISPLANGGGGAGAAGVLPTREGVDATLNPILQSLGVGKARESVNEASLTAAARTAKPSDPSTTTAGSPETVQARKGGIAMTFGLDANDKPKSTAATTSERPVAPRPKLSRTGPPRSVRERLEAQAAAKKAAEEAKDAAASHNAMAGEPIASGRRAGAGGVAFELNFDNATEAPPSTGTGATAAAPSWDEQPVGRQTAFRSMDDVPLPQPGPRGMEAPPPSQRCNPWDDTPVGSGGAGTGPHERGTRIGMGPDACPARERTLTPPPMPTFTARNREAGVAFDNIPVGGGGRSAGVREPVRRSSTPPPPPLSGFGPQPPHRTGVAFDDIPVGGASSRAQTRFDDVPVGGTSRNIFSNTNAYPRPPASTPHTSATAPGGGPSSFFGGVNFSNNASHDEGRGAVASGPPTRPLKKNINWDDMPVGGGTARTRSPGVETIVKDDKEEPFFDEEVSGFGRLSRRPENATRMSYSFRSPVRRGDGGDGGFAQMHRDHMDSPVRGAVHSPGPGRPTTLASAPTGAGAFVNPFSSVSRLSASDGPNRNINVNVNNGYNAPPPPQQQQQQQQQQRRADSPSPRFGGGIGVLHDDATRTERHHRQATPSVHPYNWEEEEEEAARRAQERRYSAYGSHRYSHPTVPNPFSPQRTNEVRFSTNVAGATTPMGRPTSQPYDLHPTQNNPVRFSVNDPLNSPISALSASGTMLGGSGRGAIGGRGQPPHSSPFALSRGARGPPYPHHAQGTRDTLQYGQTGGRSASLYINEYNDAMASPTARVRPRGTTAMDPVWSRPTAEFTAAPNVRPSRAFTRSPPPPPLTAAHAGTATPQRRRPSFFASSSDGTAASSSAAASRMHPAQAADTRAPWSSRGVRGTSGPYATTNYGDYAIHRQTVHDGDAPVHSTRGVPESSYQRDGGGGDSPPVGRERIGSLVSAPGSALLGTRRPTSSLHRPPLHPRNGGGGGGTAGVPPLSSQRGILRRPSAMTAAMRSPQSRRMAMAAAQRHTTAASSVGFSDDVPASAAARSQYPHEPSGYRRDPNAFEQHDLNTYRFPANHPTSHGVSGFGDDPGPPTSREYTPPPPSSAPRSALADLSHVDTSRLTPQERVALRRQRTQRLRNMAAFESDLKENYMMGSDPKRARFEASSWSHGQGGAAGEGYDAWGLSDLRQRLPAAFTAAAAAAAAAGTGGNVAADDKAQRNQGDTTASPGEDSAVAAPSVIHGKTVLSEAQQRLEEEAVARSMGLPVRAGGVRTYVDPITGERVPLGPGMASTSTHEDASNPSVTIPATSTASHDERVLEEARRQRMVRDGRVLEVMADSQELRADGMNISFTLRDIANAFLYMPSGTPPERDVCSGAWQSDGVSYFISTKPTRPRGGWESYLERLNLYQEPFYLRDRAFVMVLRVPHVPTLRVCVAVHNINDFIALLYQAPLAKILPTREDAWIREQQFGSELLVDSEDDDDLVRTGKAAKAKGEYVEEDALVETRWFFGLFTTRKRVTVRRKVFQGSNERGETQQDGHPIQTPQDITSSAESDRARKAKCRKIRRQFMQEGLQLTWKHKMYLIYAQARATWRSPAYHACTSPLLTDPAAFRSRMSFLSDRIVAYAAVRHKINTLKALRQSYITRRAEEIARSRILRITDGTSFAPSNVSLGGGGGGPGSSSGATRGGTSSVVRRPGQGSNMSSTSGTTSSRLRRTSPPPWTRSRTQSPTASTSTSAAAAAVPPPTVRTASARGGMAMTFSFDEPKPRSRTQTPGNPVETDAAPPAERRRGGGIAFTLDADPTPTPAPRAPLSARRVNTADRFSSPQDKSVGESVPVDAKRTTGGIALTFDNSPVKRTSTPPPSAVRRAAPATLRTKTVLRKREPFRVNRIGDGGASGGSTTTTTTTTAPPNGKPDASPSAPESLPSGIAAYHASGSLRPAQTPREEHHALVAQSKQDANRLDLVLHVQRNDTLAQTLAKLEDSKRNGIAPPLTTVLRLVPHQHQLVRGAGGGGLVSHEDAPLYAGLVPTPIEVHRQMEHYNISVAQLQQLLQWQWEHYQNSYELMPLPIFRGSVVPSVEDVFQFFGETHSNAPGQRQKRAGERFPHWQGTSKLGISALSRVLLLSLVRWSWLAPVDYEAWWRGRRHGRAPRLNLLSNCFAFLRRRSSGSGSGRHRKRRGLFLRGTVASENRGGGGGGGGPLGLHHRHIVGALLLLSLMARYPGAALLVFLIMVMFFFFGHAVCGFLGIRRRALTVKQSRYARPRVYTPTGFCAWVYHHVPLVGCFCDLLCDLFLGGRASARGHGKRTLDADEVYLPPKDEQVTMLYRHGESTAEVLLEEAHDFPRQVLVTRLLQLHGLLCSLWSRTVLLLRGHSPLLSLLLATIVASYLLLFFAFVELMNGLAAGRSWWLAMFSPADALQAVVLPLLLENEQLVSQVADLLWQRVGGGAATHHVPPTPQALPSEDDSGSSEETYQYFQNGKYYTYTTHKARDESYGNADAGFHGDHAPVRQDRAASTTGPHSSSTSAGTIDLFRLRKMREYFLGGRDGSGQGSTARAAAESMRALWADIVSVVKNATEAAQGSGTGADSSATPSPFSRYRMETSGASSRMRCFTSPTQAVIPFLLFAYVVTMCVPWSPFRQLWRRAWELFLHDDALVRRPILSF